MTRYTLTTQDSERIEQLFARKWYYAFGYVLFAIWCILCGIHIYFTFTSYTFGYYIRNLTIQMFTVLLSGILTWRFWHNGRFRNRKHFSAKRYRCYSAVLVKKQLSWANRRLGNYFVVPKDTTIALKGRRTVSVAALNKSEYLNAVEGERVIIIRFRNKNMIAVRMAKDQPSAVFWN